MVQTYYRVKCKCSAKVEGNISSASMVDGLIGSNECMHFRFEVYCTTRLGWFFGANAKVEFRIFVTLLSVYENPTFLVLCFISLKGLVRTMGVAWLLHARGA